VSSREREGLLARVRHIRRIAAADEPAQSSAGRPAPNGLEALEARIKHLEQQLAGLQDSVHRESLRQGQRLSELEAQVKPAAMRVALSDDARERGL
jgi:hypothetical protein